MEHYFTNNENLKSDFRTISYRHDDVILEFTSDLGVFSKNKVDYGSKLLIETYIKFGRQHITLLDLGCGYGVIGLSLAKLMDIKPTLVDINKRALHLSKMNASKLNVLAEIIESNIYDKIKKHFDVIVTNPPIRAGKQTVMSILLEAKQYLKPNGELWFVMRKDQGAKSAITKLQNFYEVEIKEKSKGFYVICCKKSIDIDLNY